MHPSSKINVLFPELANTEKLLLRVLCVAYLAAQPVHQPAAGR
jgi:hypothetical protein